LFGGEEHVTSGDIYFGGRAASPLAPGHATSPWRWRGKLAFFEQGRLIATSMPNAKLGPLDRGNHTLLATWTSLVEPHQQNEGAFVVPNQPAPE
jgi:hypothetical protein